MAGHYNIPGLEALKNIPGVNVNVVRTGAPIIVGNQRFVPPKAGPKYTGPYVTKKVDNKFNFTNTQIDNCAIGNKGPVDFHNKKEVFEKGAHKTDVDISGGNFVQPNFGGDVTYENKNSTLTAGQVKAGGVGASRGDWKINVNETIVAILKSGLSTELLLEALRKGKKLTEIRDFTDKMAGMDMDVMFPSFLGSTDADMETS